MKRWLVPFMVILTHSFCLGSEEKEFLKIHRTSSEIIFDGICNESLWDEVVPLPMQMFRPNHGSKPTEKSEVFITFDDHFFYVGARLHYANGSKIRATSKIRDGVDGGSDFLGLLLDTFNDNENALCFETNPVGMRSDFSISNDAQVNMMERPFNRDWNTFWDVKTNTIDEVLHIELRIPFSSLRFQETDGKVIMGMTVWRTINSKQEWSIFPLMSSEFGMFGVWKPSQAQKIVLEGVTRTNPFYITPYVLGGFEEKQELNELGTDYERKDDYVGNVGLDVKYSINSNTTLDLTLNTDFAQVEVDDQMVNLTRFSLFFPEKRQFFLERSSLFSMKTGFLDQLFYSRRIGIYEDDIVPIYGGARIIGRSGKYDWGLMNMQTRYHEYYNEDEDSIEVIESTNYGVYRLRKQVFNERSYAGGMVTSKVDIKGNYNINGAVDLIVNPFKNDYITANYIQTFDSDAENTGPFWDHGKVFLNWENRANVGLTYNLMLSRAGPLYNPEMGFELIEDYSLVIASLGYGWNYNQPEIKLFSQQINAWSWYNKNNTDGLLDNHHSALGYIVSMKNGFQGNIDIIYSRENLRETFELSDSVYFEPGRYEYAHADGRFGTPMNKLFSFQTIFSLGQYYDGTNYTIGPAEIMMRVSPSVRLGLTYQYSKVDVNPRDQHFRSHLVRLKTDFTFTTKLSLLMYFQYSSDEKFGVNNIRFRYNPREGNDLYLVYNGQYNTHLTRELPSLPMNEVNTILLKYTYTFILEKKG